MRIVFKKIMLLLLMTMILIINPLNAFASMLTIQNVALRFGNSDTINALNASGASLSAVPDQDNNKLDIYNGNSKAFSFNYGVDYIECDYRDVVIDEDNFSETLAVAFYIQGIVESIFDLSNHSDKTLDNNQEYDGSFEDYGLQVETGDYQFNDNGSIEGTYVKYFKISLDTEKIDALVTRYGIDKDSDFIDDLIPALEAKDITKNSITLYPNLDEYENVTEEDEITCYIFRSTSESGEYSKISDAAINCHGEVGLVDDGLESDTTYYYKAIVNGGSDYSPIISAKTLSTTPINENNNNTNNNPSNGTTNDKTNPATGVFLPLASIVMLLFIGKGILSYTKKKRLFK